MKSWHTLTCLMLMAAIVTACGGAQATEVEEVAVVDYESDSLDTRFEGALDIGGQLALGTLQLEETEHAVTEEQARNLLPLWQALQGGVTAEDEVNAVLKGIEGAMTQEQLATIADMALTQEDMQAWMEEQGLDGGRGLPGAGGDLDARATRRAESGGEGTPPGDQMPADGEIATRRAEFQNLSEEEREAMRATMQAGGVVGAGFCGAAGGVGDAGPEALGSARLLLRPLFTMLTARSG